MSVSFGGVRAIVLSGHGTVFDSAAAVRSAADALGERTEALAALWAAKRFEYAWIATATGRRTELWQITGEALDHAMAALGLGQNRLLRARLMQGLLQAPPFPDARPALAALAGNRHRPLALLTNASTMMATATAKAGEVFALFDALLSAEPTGVFKPSPVVYQLAPARFGLAPGEIAYVSAHPWDIAGATLAGLRTIWLNRTGAVAEFSWAPPAAVIASLAELPGLVEAGQKVA
ncbi:haloacid dehalogenase type II [Elioraea tepida]|jgi:2-haloacid dehalogenase|uniref:Haloacid dehalogenase type II n=1 Tax=Elioraea tepida TaxID=2843330 RepID=A0A975YJX9_9PROT|nr:haloacid dehalogenase type II [Elioraea tepida]QXM25121.1 haloacid dehalogenase type II [Elioraea tepida]